MNYKNVEKGTFSKKERKVQVKMSLKLSNFLLQNPTLFQFNQ